MVLLLGVGHTGGGPVPAVRGDLLRHGVGDEVADRPARRRPGARRSLDETSRRGMSKKRTRVPSCSGARRAARSSARDVVALGDGQLGEAQDLPGSRHVGRLSAMSPPTMNVSSSPGSRSCSSAQRIDRVRRPLALELQAARRRAPASPATASRHSSSRRLRARVVGDLLVRRRGRRASAATRSRSSCDARLLGADEVAEVRRVERPAEDPDARHAAGRQTARGRRR